MSSPEEEEPEETPAEPGKSSGNGDAPDPAHQDPPLPSRKWRRGSAEN